MWLLGAFAGECLFLCGATAIEHITHHDINRLIGTPATVFAALGLIVLGALLGKAAE
jgi:hypothetical protein